jgi:hypothetical protein
VVVDILCGVLRVLKLVKGAATRKEERKEGRKGEGRKGEGRKKEEEVLITWPLSNNLVFVFILVADQTFRMHSLWAFD